MADEDEIAAVKRLLDPDAADSGYTDEYIGNSLDAGETADQIAHSFWAVRAAETAKLVNVSESGSSRNLSEIHKNAVNMMKMYRDRIDAGSSPESGTRGLRSHPMRRV